jgi:hypothetical protein
MALAWESSLKDRENWSKMGFIIQIMGLRKQGGNGQVTP